ncbi:MAG: hypothetical protein V2A62_00015 [Candidatus Woesearchaeota archaeon]
MLKFLTNLFQKPEEVILELSSSHFLEWLEKEVAQSHFARYLPEYFRQLSQLKPELQEKTKILREKEISEEHKRMDPRIKTIVLGNRQHYLQAVENFAEKMVIPADLLFTSLEDLKKAQEFNHDLNQKMNQFSHFTEKSYHAAKHLFYEEVDEIAKVLRNINSLLRECEQKSKDLILMQKIKQNFVELVQEKNKKEDLLIKIKEVQEILQKLSAQEKKAQEEEKKLLGSEEYNIYLNLKEKEQQLQAQLENTEREVHAFIFKLSKPLRKFQYSAENKLLESYLTDSVKAFEEDEELQIISILEALKESLKLGRIKFEDKLQKNYLDQLQSPDKLKELKKKWKELVQEKERLVKEITHHPTAKKLQKEYFLIQQLKEDLPRQDKILLELQQKLQKIDLEQLQKEISVNVEKTFKKKIKISI